MANLTSIHLAWSVREVAERALGVAADRAEASRRALAVALADVRRQAGVSLRATADALDCSAAMLHDIEHGRRWSEGIVMRYYDWCRMLTSHATWRDGPAPDAYDEGCPVGDPSCTSGDGECHDACTTVEGGDDA